MKRFVSLSDLHYPYQDERAVALVKAFLEDFRPDVLVLNGDIWDMPAISRYHPRRQEVLRELPLQEHIDRGTEGVSGIIDSAGAKRNLLALGNHEDRWNQYLGTQARALASLRCLDFDQLFQLGGLEWKEYGEGFWLNENLFAYHGNFHGVSALRKERDRSGVSTITGHGHTQGVQYHSDRLRTFKSVAQGCLCALDPPYSRIPTNWQHGFVYGYLLDNDKFRAIEVEILHGDDGSWMLAEGVLYRLPPGAKKVITKRVRQ